MRQNKLRYATKVNKIFLKKLILSKSWSYDLVGYISHKDLITKIKNASIGLGIIPKGARLNPKYNSKLNKETFTPIKVNNYYFEPKEMHPLQQLYKLL